MILIRSHLVCAAVVAALAATGASAAPFTPYTPVPFTPGITGGGVPLPAALHPGKEYSNELDRDLLGFADPEQTILWDGSGGVLDGVDYGGTGDVDALANHADAFFAEVVDNATPVLFSTRVGPTLPGGLGSGVDGGAPMLGCPPGIPVCFETTGGAGGIWALPPEVDADHPPTNLDGLEVFGPEPGPGLPPALSSDSDRYSLAGDIVTGVSIFQYDPGTGISTPWLMYTDLVAALIAFDPIYEFVQGQIDLDALMVSDVTPDPVGPGGPEPGLFDPLMGDRILFSLWEIGALPGFDGDAAFVWDVAGIRYFDHGGHLWDRGWLGEPLDVDALEAAVVPVPAALPLLASGLLTLAGIARRRTRTAV